MVPGFRVAVGLSTGVVPSVDELHLCHYRWVTSTGPAGRAYFQRVAMPKAAAMPPIPIRMFQLPRAAMKGICAPAM